ncbi:MAG: WcaF family extracellular polysaccharide biosynthesis acetyltransferase [Verrucomicrobiota bacterium]|nr:WcaF family extracellular polysaccharide biosynthesis acetyltransferase [Verrucomicrobiota bacterium]
MFPRNPANPEAGLGLQTKNHDEPVKTNHQHTRVRNDLFNPKSGLDRGRSRSVEAVWYLIKCLIFLSPLPFPSSMKRTILRWFGAKIGKGVVIKPRVNIHLPWKLSVGDFTWIGEEVSILNFEQIAIGSHCCVSQRAFLCAGNHDYSIPNMCYRNDPITLQDGVWVGAQSFVAPGVTISTDAVISAGSIVTRDQPAEMVCSGNPCLPIKNRWTGLPLRRPLAEPIPLTLSDLECEIERGDLQLAENG